MSTIVPLRHRRRDTSETNSVVSFISDFKATLYPLDSDLSNFSSRNYMRAYFTIYPSFGSVRAKGSPNDTYRSVGTW